MADSEMSQTSESTTARGRPRTRVRAPHLRVAIDNETIEGSVRRSSSHCMIAEAVRAAAPQFVSVTVDLSTIRFTDKERRLRFVYLTPRVAQVALIDFDRGVKPEPFSFVLRTPAQIVRSTHKNPANETRTQAELELHKRTQDAATSKMRYQREAVDVTKPYQPPAEHVERALRALESPDLLIGPAIPIYSRDSADNDVRVPIMVGGKLPPQGNLSNEKKRGASKDAGNLAKVRRFGLRQLRE